MPTDKVWPIDKFGNEIRAGKLIHLKLEEASAEFHVMEVEAASVIHSADGPMPVNGEIVIGLKLRIPFTPEHRQMIKAMVIEQPVEPGPQLVRG